MPPMLDRLIDTLRNLIPMTSIDPNVPVLDETALAEAIDAGEELIVVFYADWCGFCRAFLPTYEDRAEALPYTAVAANISEQTDPRWETYDVDTVPTLVAFADGEEVARIGAQPGRGLEGKHLDEMIDAVPA